MCNFVFNKLLNSSCLIRLFDEIQNDGDSVAEIITWQRIILRFTYYFIYYNHI